MIAYCYRNGVIKFGKTEPKGALEISRGSGKTWKAKISARARLHFDGKTLLVPGIPEAKNNKEAIDALLKFTKFVNKD